MNLESSQLPNGVTRIKLNGHLDFAGVEAIETRFLALCDGNPPRVLVDLSGVGFISSLGIRMLLQALKTVLARGGRLVLCNPLRIVDSALDFSGLGQYVVRGDEAKVGAKLLESCK